MSEFLWVKLVEGRRVRNPATGSILSPEKVYRFRKAQFWFRRLAAGDLVMCDDPSATQPAERAKAAPKKKEKAGE